MPLHSALLHNLLRRTCCFLLAGKEEDLAEVVGLGCMEVEGVLENIHKHR